MVNKGIALVTGASGGIGSAIAQRLASDGHFILIHCHKGKEKADECLNSILKNHGQGEVISFDVANKDELEGKLDLFFKSRPDLQLTILINNAAITRDNLCGLMGDSEFDQVLQTNLYGPFYLSRYAIKKMIHQRKGCIVNISSLSGQIGNAGQINYAASKAGLIAMTKTLAKEIGSRGIRVNCVSPGIIETEMAENVASFEKIKDQIPLKRFGSPLEVANAVSFLCSDEASYISGETLSVNGGLFSS